MFWDVLKAVGLLIFLYALFVIGKLYKKQKEWEAQGVVFGPGFPIITDMIYFIYYLTKYPQDIAFSRIFQEYHGDNMPDKAGIFLFFMPCIMWNNCQALEELYGTKNAFYDKHKIERDFGRPMINNSIASMQTDDPAYKKKRKALSGAFLRGKIGEIIENIKEITLKTFHETQAEAKDGVTEVELNTYTSKVQSFIIVSILVGAQYSYKKLKHINIKTGEVKQITIAEFMDGIVDDITYRLSMNPFLYMGDFAETEIFALDKHYLENCRSSRQFFRDIINDKKAQKDKSTAKDIVSLLLQDENYQDSEDIIDDLFVMFIAGSKTVQTTTSNLITSMIYNPDKNAKMMAEIDPYMEKIQDDIQNKMNLEDVDELVYVKMCYQESMRRYSPAALSSTSCMNKDIKIQGVDMKKDEAFFIGIQSMH